MIKIVKATAKGQITLPAIWRKQLNTDLFKVNFNNNKFTLEPIEINKNSSKGLSLKKIIENEEKKSGLVIFNAIRDNNGKGIEVKKFLKILKEIDE